MKNLLSKADRDFLTRVRNTGWCYMPEEWEGEASRRATRLLAGGWIALRTTGIRRGNGPEYGITTKARKWLDNYIMYEARNPLQSARNYYYSVSAMTSDPDPKRVFLSQHNYMKTAGHWATSMAVARMRFETPEDAMTAAKATIDRDSAFCVDPKSFTLLKITISTTVEEADFKVE